MARTLLLELDLGQNGGRHRFYSATEIRNFVDAERAFWRNVSGDTWPTPFASLNKRLSQLEQALSSADEWTQENIDAFAAAAHTAFLSNQPIPHSASLGAKLVAEIASTDGLATARGALAAVMPWANFQTVVQESPEAMAGAFSVAMGRAGVTRTSAAALIKRLDGYTRRREDQLSREREALDEFFADQQRVIAEIENDERDRVADQIRIVAELENDFRDRISLLNDDATAALDAIRTTDAQFREQMHLKAPSEYWEAKATEHRRRAKDLRAWIGGSTIVGAALYGLVFGFGFAPITEFLRSFADKPAALFIITGAAAFVLAIPLWFLRILVKFYLSEQHLSADARERHTMALTYLALANDGKVDESDRSLVLGALFRSGSDGLVKDSAGPDASFAGLISRLLEK